MPNPPTDNLYKFVTFLGVAIVLFSFWIISEAGNKAATANNSYVYAAERLDREIDSVQSQIDDLMSESTNLESKVSIAEDHPDRSNETTASLEAQLNSIKRRLTDATTAYNQLKESRKEVELKREEAKNLIDTAESTLNLYTTGVICGAIMALWGVITWYTRHQRYQDEILRANAIALRNPPSTD